MIHLLYRKGTESVQRLYSDSTETQCEKYSLYCQSNTQQLLEILIEKA